MSMKKDIGCISISPIRFKSIKDFEDFKKQLTFKVPDVVKHFEANTYEGNNVGFEIKAILPDFNSAFDCDNALLTLILKYGDVNQTVKVKWILLETEGYFSGGISEYVISELEVIERHCNISECFENKELSQFYEKTTTFQDQF